MEPIIITITVSESKEAKNMSEIKLNVDAKEEVTYNQIISALMAITENLINDNQKLQDEKNNLLVVKSTDINAQATK